MIHDPIQAQTYQPKPYRLVTWDYGTASWCLGSGVTVLWDSFWKWQKCKKD